MRIRAATQSWACQRISDPSFSCQRHSRLLACPCRRSTDRPALIAHAGSSADRRPDDVDALKAFLARYVETKTRSRTTARRSNGFCCGRRQLGKPVSSLTHEDLLAYQRFLADPGPGPLGELQPQGGARHPDWRPFRAALPVQPAPSVRDSQCHVLLAGERGYLAGNPLSLSRQRARRTRRASHDTSTTNFGRVSNKRSTACHGRRRGNARTISDPVAVHPALSRRASNLGGLREHDGKRSSRAATGTAKNDGGLRSWERKQNRLVPATAELMVELARYRRECGLAPTPLPGEQTPLVLPIGKSRRPLTRAALH
jgi:integrase/recombinase XerD